MDVLVKWDGGEEMNVVSTRDVELCNPLNS